MSLASNPKRSSGASSKECRCRCICGSIEKLDSHKRLDHSQKV
jgi:hypothetical protein